MTRTETATKRVLLLFERMIGYQHGVLLGVQRYVQSLPVRWTCIGTDPVSSNVRDIFAEAPCDGIIGLLMRPGLSEMVGALGVPVVDTANMYAGSVLPRACVDDAAVGRAAAEHLTDRGLRQFGFIGFPGEAYSDQRQAGFAGTLRAGGFDCHVLDYRKYHSVARKGGTVNAEEEPWSELPTWASGNETLRRWAMELPKPCGVFAVNDERGLRLLDSALQGGVHVPDQLAVIGVENDELLCAYAHPPLTSIAVPAERIGYEAAALLDRLMTGEAPPVAPVLVPPIGIVTRASSDVLAIDDANLVAAVRWLRANATRRIHVGDVLRHVPISRRSLEQKFMATLGHTPNDELRRVRLAYAKTLLSTTDLAIATVARQSGFSSAERLAESFAAFQGCSPTTYRRQFQLRS